MGTSLFSILHIQSKRKSCQFYFQDMSRNPPLSTTFTAILMSCLNYCAILLPHLPASRCSLHQLSIIIMRMPKKQHKPSVAYNNDASGVSWNQLGGSYPHLGSVCWLTEAIQLCCMCFSTSGGLAWASFQDDGRSTGQQVETCKSPRSLGLQPSCYYFHLILSAEASHRLKPW